MSSVSGETVNGGALSPESLQTLPWLSTVNITTYLDFFFSNYVPSDPIMKYQTLVF